MGERAKGVLPEYHERIEQAVQLLRTGEVQWRHDGSVHAVAFSPDGSALVSGDRQGNLRVWDLATGKEQFKHAAPGGDILGNLVFANGGSPLTYHARAFGTHTPSVA